MNMHGLTTAMDEFAAFAPNLIAGLVILLIGYVIAVVLARITRAILRRVGFDRLTARMGIRSSAQPDIGSRWAGTAVYIVVLLATVMQVARVWNLTFVATGFARLVAYVPHVLGAIVIMGAAVLLGNWLRDQLMRRALLDPNADRDTQVRLLPSVVRMAVLVIGAFMALRELQIAPEIVNLAFTLTLGAITLAAALAFGLGGRDVAGRIAQSWYERRRASKATQEDIVAPRST
jgi:hypothetical protein